MRDRTAMETPMIVLTILLIIVMSPIIILHMIGLGIYNLSKMVYESYKEVRDEQ